MTDTLLLVPKGLVKFNKWFRRCYLKEIVDGQQTMITIARLEPMIQLG